MPTSARTPDQRSDRYVYLFRMVRGASVGRCPHPGECAPCRHPGARLHRRQNAVRQEREDTQCNGSCGNQQYDARGSASRPEVIGPAAKTPSCATRAGLERSAIPCAGLTYFVRASPPMIVG
jgi:hypothetical protein